MSLFESSPTAENILAWLQEGGYSYVLYLGQHQAYVTDEDDDFGWQPIPVAVARTLLAVGKIALWDHKNANPDEKGYISYRPADWVKAWNMGQRPWYGHYQNQQILEEHHATIARRLLESYESDR